MIYLLIAITFVFPKGDWKPTQDKYSHAFMGYTVSSISYSLLTIDWIHNTMLGEEANNYQKISFSIMSGMMAGYMKEGHDLMNGGEANGYDWLYTITGGILGTLLTDWIYNKVPNL